MPVLSELCLISVWYRELMQLILLAMKPRPHPPAGQFNTTISRTTLPITCKLPKAHLWRTRKPLTLRCSACRLNRPTKPPPHPTDKRHNPCQALARKLPCRLRALHSQRKWNRRRNQCQLSNRSWQHSTPHPPGKTSIFLLSPSPRSRSTSLP